MTSTTLDAELPGGSNVAGVLIPRWVQSTPQAERAARSQDSKAVWIVSEARFADWIAHFVAEVPSSKKTGHIMLLSEARLALFIALAKRFRTVAYASTALPKKELNEVLRASDRSDRFVGGVVDEQSETITLWRGDLKPLIVPYDAFPPTANDIRPKFSEFSVTDYGQTVKFGDYESSAEAVLYEYDPEFRRRLKQGRFAKEQTIGASIRRLRMQRRLTLDDFGDVGPKTLARIELGIVRVPRRETLRKIAKRLKVKPEELGTF